MRKQQQVKEGIDAVIVDSVLKIRNGLTKTAKPTEFSGWRADGLADGGTGVQSPAVVEGTNSGLSSST